MKVHGWCVEYRGGSRIFFRRGCTRLLLCFNTNKPHSFFFFCRIPVALENCRSSQRGREGVHPLHPPPRSAPGVWLLWQLDTRFAVVFRFLLVNTAMRFFKTSLFSTENVWALKVSAVLRLCIPILRTIACLVSVTVRHLINFFHTRVTRNLTSNAAHFKDLTKMWYVLFAYGTTSKFC